MMKTKNGIHPNRSELDYKQVRGLEDRADSDQ